jgi:Putative prokaryotic signal transducing protein
MNDHREELAATFAQMGDEELLERWRSGVLTEVAVEVARDELARRGIDAPQFVPLEFLDEDSTGQGDVSFVTVARSLEPLQIEMLRARLQAEGIMAFAIDAGINQANALVSIAVGGVRLMVPRESADEARRIIGLIRSGRFALRDGDEAMS